MSYYDLLFNQNNILKYIQNSDRFQEYTQKFNISKSDPIEYMAFCSFNSFNEMQALNQQLAQKIIGPNKACTDLSKVIVEHIFNPLNYIDKSLEQYNSQFIGFNKLSGKNPNPYIITQSQFLDYLNDTNSKEPQKNIEHYLKVMTLSNKASKIISAFKKHNVTQAKDIAKMINQQNFKNSKKQKYSTYTNDYNDMFSNLDSLSSIPQADGHVLKVDFLNLYAKYIKKEISRNDLESNPIYQNMLNLFNKNNPKNCYIDPGIIFKSLAFNRSISNLYLNKNLFFKKAFKEYVDLSKSNQSYKYRVTKSTDNTINHPSSRTCYNTSINFCIRGYNTPFNIHQDPKVITHLEKIHGISLEEGNIVHEVLPILPYKYNASQKSQISKIHDQRRFRANSKEERISTFSTDMLFYIEGLDKLTNSDFTAPTSPKNNPTII